mgnify:CR=1 FL=1
MAVARNFLPFNQGSNGAGNVGSAGNPTNLDTYDTSYLWESVFNEIMLEICKNICIYPL